MVRYRMIAEEDGKQAIFDKNYAVLNGEKALDVEGFDFFKRREESWQRGAAAPHLPLPCPALTIVEDNNSQK